MKKTLLLMVSVLISILTYAQTVVPDAQFRTFLTTKYSIQFDNQNAIIPNSVVDTLTLLNVGYQNIADLKGIEAFKSLKIFVCAGNQLQNLNLSGNSKLWKLNFSDNNISKIDLAANAELRALSCGGNPIDSLDLSHQTNLYDFFCENASKLSSVYFGKNDSIVDIWVTSSLINKLDISECSNLRALALTDNKLKKLDISKNPLLQYLSIKNNEVDSINISNNNNLSNIDCSGNKLTNLNVSKLSYLTMLNCSFNQLKKIDVSQNKQLFYLDCSNNQLTSLDIANCRNMNMMDVSNNYNLTCCYVWTTPFPKFGTTVKTLNAPVNFYVAGNKLKDILEHIYNAPTALKKQVTDSVMATIKSFPLIENDTLATFMYRGKEKSVLLTGDAFEWSSTGTTLSNIPETDLWILGQLYETDARLDYKFIADGNWILDPLNKLTCAGGFGNNSELRMPQYQSSPETEYYAGIPHGQVLTQTISSTNLNNSRTIQIYLPPSYSIANKDSFPLAIFHDGLEYISLAKANNTLDYLIAHQKIRPIIGVFIPPVDRPNEYVGSLTPKFTKFISDEILPLVSSQFRVLSAPKYRASIGISNGGDISQHLGFKLSDKIGNVGSFSAGGGYTNEYLSVSKLNLKYYIDAGTYDQAGFLGNNQNFVNWVLKTKGYDYNFKIFHEGHSWGNWKAHLHYALEDFFPYQDSYQDVNPVYSDLNSNMMIENYPNPFRGTTTIRYNCANSGNVKITITDAMGRTVDTLVNQLMPAGTHEVVFNATTLSNGVYFASIYNGSNKANSIKLIQINNN